MVARKLLARFPYWAATRRNSMLIQNAVKPRPSGRGYKAHAIGVVSEAQAAACGGGGRAAGARKMCQRRGIRLPFPWTEDRT